MNDPLLARFDDLVVVVTGVGRAGQVGEAVAQEFARRGAHVALIDRSSTLADERAAALRADGFRATAFSCDLTDHDATKEVAKRVADSCGASIHALANVAGGFATSGPVGESDPSVLDRQMAINLTSAYSASRAFLPYLRRTHGSLVYMASAAVLPGGKVAEMFAYVAAKTGVVALMRAVAQEERANGVRANALAPTAIRTSANLDTMGAAFPYVERERVAEMIAFLCSPAATNITGQVIEMA